ncbi:MAG: hypothetical protein FWB97_10370 [Oscillospiraceae bacterium]|nr:hypothetical protein [Oscillospiraceae bacterium]
MKRRLILSIVLVLAAMASAGCAAILEDDRVTESAHVINPVVRPPDPQIEVSNFEELKEAIIELIMAHETNARIVAFSYDSEDMQMDLDRAISEILMHHPIGVYAVSEIVGQATKIVTFFEINISIEYMRTSQQLNSIINVTGLPELMAELLEIMSEYSDEATFRTPLQMSADELVGHIVDIYYQNPRSIVMRPIVAVEVFPEVGDDRIFSVRFDFGRPPGILRQLGESLTLAFQSNIEAAEGGANAELLLSLAKNLIAFADFDEATARTIPAHGPQNLAATAFGALINGSAIGEGFAMAFKALSTELGVDTRIVLGRLDGRYHAWNLVRLYDYYYHIDVAMGDVNGIETAFLLSDAQLIYSNYTWDFENTPYADGPLTFEVVAGSEYEYDYQDESGNAGVIPPRPGANVPETPDLFPDAAPEEPDEPDLPDIPDMPDESDEPEVTEPSEGSEVPEEPYEPEEPDEPDEYNT